jgi:deoxyribodipyrimidine photo-lyase
MDEPTRRDDLTVAASPTAVPRQRAANDCPIRPERSYVLYWMIAARRPSWNFALDRAVDHARALRKPLVVFEALEVDYPWASDRLHAFVIEGMRDNAHAFAGTPVTYFPYVEPKPGDGRGLLAALARSACVVVTDEFPCFFLPRIVSAAARRIDVRLEAVDSNGLIPLALADRPFPTAAVFRRFVQRVLPSQLNVIPREKPLEDGSLASLPALPDDVATRWPPVSSDLLDDVAAAVRSMPIDHSVPKVAQRGGPDAARRALDAFVTGRLPRYGELHNEPEADVTSRLSPYLHFGHLSAHQVFDRVMRQEGWSKRRIAGKPANGAREGWWGASAPTERFLDQLIVWRELGYNMCAKRPGDYDRYESLPAWAQETLRAHGSDRRTHVYDLDTLERGRTHDPLWNAAQGQLLREGWFHNYMRMLWGKKILEWSRTPQDALERMVTIMNRWSLDGRNPNSYSGYFWTLGRYDRPWPERAIFGTVRMMSSANTARKIAVKKYISEFAPAGRDTPQRELPGLL